MAFLCRVVGGELQANRDESMNPRWIKLAELGQMLQERPEEIFPIGLPVLRRYVGHARSDMELADADVKGASPNGQ
jgi:hypothetical protein